eukprot:TRINITY_DN2021_c0_g1_i1.p1 TRINITY_DN2021_c0_g1~~TRINITY_DN2021_c0_g1_i1.p1  ORF type:complete len:102 (+),score=20.95 TRINITY_DN2021_c0_g1_i1:88-393(+)
MSHTILLIQPTQSPASRTYSDYENVNQAMEGVCKMFEGHLKSTYPTKVNINYEVGDLYAFIDALSDMSALVHDKKSNNYVPHNKDWIKERVFAMLKKQMSQ